jgi:hypothetical protein
MECRITSHAKRHRAGFSFVELSIALGLSSVLVLVLASLSLYTSKRFVATAASTELSYKSRNALDLLTSDLRQMTSLTNFTTNSITVLDLATNTTSYTWDSATKQLQRVKNGGVRILLEECDWLAFSMFKASPIDGQLDVEPTTKTKECKALKVEWTCSRTHPSAAVKAQVNVAETIVLRLQGL